MRNSRSIRQKVFTFSLVFFLVFLIGGGAAFFAVINTNVHNTAQHELESLAEFERTAIVGEVDKQIALAVQMSNSAVIQSYLRNQTDEAIAKQAFSEFQSYAKSFNTQNLFWSFEQKNPEGQHDYYFAFDFAYSFDENDSNERWFADARGAATPYVFNIDSNPKSGTKLWINAKSVDNGEFLGIVGIGAELTEFFDAIYKNLDTNVYTVYFFNDQGVITGADDPSLVEAATPLASKIDNGQKVLDAVKSLKTGEATVVRNGSQEVGLINVESIGWTMAVVTNITGAAYLTNTVTILYLVILVVVLLVIVIFNAFVLRGVITPLLPIVAAANRIAAGDVNVHIEQSNSGDEIGALQESMIHLLAATREQSATIGKISAGDYSVSYEPRSAEDVTGRELIALLEKNNNVFANINNAAQAVANGSRQIADSAQSLAQGGTEQASAVEELSASISAIAKQTKDSAAQATHAAKLSNTVRGNAEKGSAQMNEMIKAVNAISDASNNIQKVINVIDDIAFQTNILALNASVEAARAGQHGKGFAVVAEEVRNLAGKSAAAASDTGVLIANSLEKAKLGAKIAEETAASLTEIVAGINESSVIVSDIAANSEQQSLAIAQLNTGIDQVASVVQQNSATAEESAATAHQLSSQSEVLEGLVAQFKLKYDTNGAKSSGKRKKY
jgi:methyl-accepting chemotaxis protein